MTPTRESPSWGNGGRVRAACFALLAVVAVDLAGAAEIGDAAPDAVGMSAERLARIGPALQAYVDRGEVAGAVTLVARDGRVVWRHAQGLANLETGRPLRMDSLFRLASQTKPVTAVAAMILVEQGKLRIDDPVSRYLPAFADIKVGERGADGAVSFVEPNTPLTVKHLLTHTGGLSGGPVPDVASAIEARARLLDWQPSEPLAAVVDRYAQLALGFHPGDYWEYSPAAGLNVVARIIEVISGQTMAAFLREHIFDPLGMQDTFYYVPVDRLERFTVGYVRQRDGSIQAADADDGSSRFVREGLPKVLFPGAGGLVSTVHDYLRFAQMLLNGGELDGARILGPKTIELMTSPHVVDLPPLGPLAPSRRGQAYGLGVSVLMDPAAAGQAGSAGAFSWGGAFGTLFWVDPAERLIGLYMMQLQRHQPLRIRGDFQALVYAAVTESYAAGPGAATVSRPTPRSAP